MRLGVSSRRPGASRRGRSRRAGRGRRSRRSRHRSASKPNTSRFSRRRSARTDFGKTMKPFCRCQRSTACAGVTPCAAAASATAGVPNRSYLPCPSGPHDSMRMPCSVAQATTSRCWYAGCSSIWLTAGRHAGLGDDALEVRHQEVRDADAAGQPGLAQLDELRERVHVVVLRGGRPVHEVQVDRRRGRACRGSRRSPRAARRRGGGRSRAWS